MLFRYQDPIVKQAVLCLKSLGSRDIADSFAEVLYKHIASTLYKHLRRGERALIVPVPLSAGRVRKRGFNQSLVLARGIARRDRANLLLLDAKLLIKVRDTLPQTQLKNRASRLKNLRGAFFVVKPKKVAGRVVVLIDDVCTTGGTIKEARRALLVAGAKEVLAFTVAH